MYESGWEPVDTSNNDCPFIDINDSVPFYEDNYIITPRAILKNDVDLNNPHSIYDYLLSKTYNQDNYARKLSMLLYKHVHGISSRLMIVGDTGCGKTFLLECLREIYPYIIIIDASSLTKEGYVGVSVKDFLLHIDPIQASKYIIVFDEADKALCRSDKVDVNAELLKLISDKSDIQVKEDGKVRKYSTKGMSFIFSGAFTDVRDNISKSRNAKRIGFFVDSHESSYNSSDPVRLTLNDLQNHANISKELCGRLSDIININPMAEEHYYYIISKHPNSITKQLETQYSIHLNISDDYCRELAHEAFTSGLGVRFVTAQIQKRIDDFLFENDLSKYVYIT